MEIEANSPFNIDDYTGNVNNQLKTLISFEEKEGLKIIQDIPYDEPVKTISSNWLEIETLRDEYQHNPTYVQNIKNLTDKYCGWRKVRGDGNCYYRSVISAYMLHIFHFNDDQQRVIRLLGILRSIQSSDKLEADSNIFEEYKEALYYITKVLNLLYIERENRLQNFVIISHLLQNEEFDLKLIRVSRLLSYLAFNGPEGEFIRPFLDESEVDSIQSRILQMGTEAEGVELSLCPLALDILVSQVNVFESILFNTFPMEQENDENKMAKFTIHIICKSKGHYDSLYTIEDMERDDYCISEKKYMIDRPVPSFSEASLQGFYDRLRSFDY